MHELARIIRCVLEPPAKDSPRAKDAPPAKAER